MNTFLPKLVKLALLLSLFSLASCATLYNQTDKIPGLDRIINYFSKAEVGPVKTVNGDIIAQTETDLSIVENNNVGATPEQTEAAESKSPTPNSASSIETTHSTTTTAVSNNLPVMPKTDVKPTLAHKHKVKTSNNVISGNVNLLVKKSKISPKGVFVRLARVDGVALEKPAVHATHEIDMIDKSYAPGNLVIHKGDALNFVNSDFIQHNVFSSTGENAFDLGTFGGGLQREVKLNKEGVVKVYCNIHPGMAAFVAVDDKGISQVIESEDGFFEFSSLPAGEYQLTLWSVRGEQTQLVTLAAGQKQHLNLTFDTTVEEPPAHANKFGETYQKKNIRREFY